MWCRPPGPPVLGSDTMPVIMVVSFLETPTTRRQVKGATTGGSGDPPPNFLEDSQLLTQRFCRGVHRQASRVNLVYNTEEERKKKFFLLLLQVLSAFLFSMALNLAMRRDFCI